MFCLISKNQLFENILRENVGVKLRNYKDKQYAVIALPNENFKLFTHLKTSEV